MLLYERGIRRRLAPMLGNDRRRIELANSLLFTLPGTPVMRYGDEIGMGDDLDLPERYSVRTPMQWSPHRHGGFTTGAAPDPPVIDDPVYGYQQRQRRGSAARSGLAAQLDGAHHPDAKRVPRDRLGRLEDPATAAR